MSHSNIAQVFDFGELLGSSCRYFPCHFAFLFWSSLQLDRDFLDGRRNGRVGEVDQLR